MRQQLLPLGGVGARCRLHNVRRPRPSPPFLCQSLSTTLPSQRVLVQAPLTTEDPTCIRAEYGTDGTRTRTTDLIPSHLLPANLPPTFSSTIHKFTPNLISLTLWFPCSKLAFMSVRFDVGHTLLQTLSLSLYMGRFRELLLRMLSPLLTGSSSATMAQPTVRAPY